MVKRGDVIKHKRFMDVACRVVAVISDTCLAVHWVNQGFVKSYDLGLPTEIIEINKDWLICTDPIGCLRYKSWRRIA